MASTGDAKFRIMVVDDHPLVRAGLANLINRQKDVMCCGGAENISDARQAIVAQKPDLALVDLGLGEADGLDLVKELRAEMPGLRMLVLSQQDENVYAERALRAGAHGYVMKEQAADELLNAIRTVLNGQMYVSQNIAAMAVRRMIEDQPSPRRSNLASLTERERHVLKSVAAGQANREIAAELNLSVKTIETYREHLKYKLGLTSGTELTRYADQWSRAQTGLQSAPPVIADAQEQIPLREPLMP